MTPDKFSATWVSHSSISDFLNCPRAYYLKNVYKDPQTGHKLQTTSPSLSLGSAVHEVVEALSEIPTKSRFDENLVGRFNQVWTKYLGKKGGFLDSNTETLYQERGHAMIRRVMEHPGPLLNLAVKINQDLPYFWLSEDENIILSGKIDWLEYLPDEDSVHIIDFKTSKSPESDDSLQLPIYHLLVHNCQKRAVKKASYWYLEKDDAPLEKKLPDLTDAFDRVIKIAKQMKLARSLERFKCPTDGCRNCTPMEQILLGNAEFVGVSDFGRDLYLIPGRDLSTDSVIL